MIIFSRVLPAAILCCSLMGCGTSQRFGSRDGGETRTETRSKNEQSDSGTSSATLSGRVLLTLEGIASYYAQDFHGKQTSNGEIFDMNALTAAHRTFPFDTMIRVTNMNNNKSVVVRVNDRGPFVDGRIIDLSLGAAKEIDLIPTGTARVKLEVLKWGDGTLRHR
jgi:rare lipoprotein A